MIKSLYPSNDAASSACGDISKAFLTYKWPVPMGQLCHRKWVQPIFHFAQVPFEVVDRHEPTPGMSEVTGGSGPRRHALACQKTETAPKKNVGIRAVGSRRDPQGRPVKPAVEKGALGLKLTVAFCERPGPRRDSPYILG
jgi:hypothetical protein